MALSSRKQSQTFMKPLLRMADVILRGLAPRAHLSPQAGRGRRALARRVRAPAHTHGLAATPPCMFGTPTQRILGDASRPVATGLDADGRDRSAPLVVSTAGEPGPSVLWLLS